MSAKTQNTNATKSRKTRKPAQRRDTSVPSKSAIAKAAKTADTPEAGEVITKGNWDEGQTAEYVDKWLPVITDAERTVKESLFTLAGKWYEAREAFLDYCKANNLNTRSGGWFKLIESAGHSNKKAVDRLVKIGESVAVGAIGKVDIAQLPQGLSTLEKVAAIKDEKVLQSAIDNQVITPDMTRAKLTEAVKEIAAQHPEAVPGMQKTPEQLAKEEEREAERQAAARERAYDGFKAILNGPDAAQLVARVMLDSGLTVDAVATAYAEIEARNAESLDEAAH